MSTDVAVPEPWGLAVSFDELVESGVDEVAGRDVFNKENKASLVGVPFVITKVRFNDGDTGGDFVSCEATTKGGDQVVVNDGSTGIRRQIVSYLIHKGIIDVGASLAPDANLLDKPHGTWARGGEDDAKAGYEIKLLAKRGLRESSYTAEEAAQAGTTYYLA